MADNGRSSRPRRAPARSRRSTSSSGASGSGASGSGSSSAGATSASASPRTATSAASRAAAPTPSRRAASSSATRRSTRSGWRRFFDYPRSGYTGLHRWLPSWRVVVGTFLGGCFLLAGGIVAAYATIDIPRAGEDISAQTTSVYFAGDTPDQPGPLMGKLPGVNRQIVDTTTMPEYIGQAVAAGEDKTFFTNSGVDLKGMARAMFANVTKGTRQGGSSLTQEYVERYYVGETTTSYVGKFKETLLALKIGRTQSKAEILDRYLNTIYFGRGAYGIQAASKAYYGVDAQDLTLSQAAMLAGIIPSPSYWDPAVRPEQAESRWNTILDSMESMGWITPAQRAEQEFPKTIAVKNNETFKGTNGYLLKMVVAELGKHDYSEDNLERGGYSIITTIQKPAQDAAVTAAKEVWDGTIGQGMKPSKSLRLSIVSVDPKDGAIVSLYGGKDFLTDQRNSATYDNVQAGSTFKPFTLIGALQQGIGLDATYNGNSPQTLPGWKDPVRNDDSTWWGRINLVKATAHSVNTVFAQVNNQIGWETTAQVAAAAGVQSPVPVVASNVLGTAVVHPLEMAGAYATFAAEGKRSSTFVVRTMLSHKGSVVYAAKPDTTQVFDPSIVAEATYAMTQVVQDGTGKDWIKPLDRPIAGKTGTTNDTKAAWFVGYTPHISTAVALSQDGGETGTSQVSITPFEPKLKYVFGGTTPAHIWNSYMSRVFELPQYADKTEFPERTDAAAKQTSTTAPTPSTSPTPEVTQKPTKIAVPYGLIGRLEADATSQLYAVGLTATITSAHSDTVGVGRVISVKPGSGTKVSTDRAIELVISTGPRTPATQEPSAPPATTPPPTQGAGGDGDEAGGDGDGSGGDGGQDAGSGTDDGSGADAGSGSAAGSGSGPTSGTGSGGTKG